MCVFLIAFFLKIFKETFSALKANFSNSRKKLLHIQRFNKALEYLYLLLRINANIIFHRKINLNKQCRKLPNLLPFLGIAMKEPRLPPMTLCGLRKGGFLKDPVYWWRNECMLWDVGGLPFFTIGSTIHRIKIFVATSKQDCQEHARRKKQKEKKELLNRKSPVC